MVSPLPLKAFIITIPIQTHATKLDLPPPNPNTPQDIKPDFNQINIDFQFQRHGDGAGLVEFSLHQITARQHHAQPLAEQRWAEQKPLSRRR